MELKLYIRQNPVFDLSNNQIYYDGTSPHNLQPVIGTLPVARQWQNYNNFIDATQYVSDIHQLSLSVSSQRDDSGNVISSQNQVKKASSGLLTFEGLAYDLIKQWLIDDVSASLNSIEVRIEYLGCGTFEGYKIQSQDINWCEGGMCQYQIGLVQQDEAYSCIKRTLITDNWQGWFQKVPANGKKHPRFSYCNEVRPNSTLVIEWYILTSIFSSSFLFLIPLLLTINPILWILQQIQNLFNANWGIPGPLNLGDIFDGISTVYIESAGCGREHPAPLIRDYITNVCDKCGVTVNAQTAPIFFSPTIDFDTSTGLEANSDNDYYRLCYKNAPVKRGLRRFRWMSIGGGFQGANDEYWIPDNQPLLTLDQLLDEVLPVVNHEWKVKNNELIIRRKDQMNTQGYIYDFTQGSPDRAKILEGVCFEPTNEKFPAYCSGIYTPDGADSCGNEAGNVNGAGQMNGIVAFVANQGGSNMPVNPNFSGSLDKTTAFGATKFRFDGTSGDYIYDAFQVVMNGAGFSVLGLPGAIFTTLQQVAERLAEYADNVLLLQSETAIQPKLLIWDGISYENARATKIKAAWDGVAPQPMPNKNTYYNPSEEWKVRHYPETDVIGKNLTFAASPNGIYRVTDLLGIILTERPALLMNYPMFFEPFYKGTLWDRFHWIDDPNRNPKMNYTWHVKIRLCCEDLEILGVLNDGNSVVLNEKVKLPFGYYQEGTIKEIIMSFDPSDELGRWIELRGTL